MLQTKSLLSFPPDASCYSSKLHLRPQTSCLCPKSLASKLFLVLKSLCRMLLSREPVLRNLLFHATLPTLPSCPESYLTILHFAVSHIWRFPEFVPTARCTPELDHCTLVTESPVPKSYSFVTLLVVADHRYTLEPKPTAKIFEDDQSTKLR